MWTMSRLKRLFLMISTAVIAVCLVMYLWFPYHLSLRAIKSRLATYDQFVYPQPLPLSRSAVNLDMDQAAADGVKCVHPPLDPNDPAIMQYYAKEGRVNCSSAMKDWVYVTNGTFHISRDAIRQYGDITCDYVPFFRQTDFAVKYGEHVKPMLDGTPLQSDFFTVSCVSAKGKTYKNGFASVARDKAIMARLRKYRSSAKPKHPLDKHRNSSMSPNNKTHQDASLSNLGIFMLGFDSMSRMAWYRNLPKSHEYFTGKLGAIELKNYNIMGDATAAALLPMFTGQKKEELPEARPGVQSGKPIDDYPFIWKEFSKHGYVTAFAQDRPIIGAFQVNMRGFTNQPTDHYMRTFYLGAEKEKLKNPPLCWGSKPRHKNFMDWFGSLLDMYKDFPKFFVGHYLEMSHDHMNRIQGMDDDLVAFLQELEVKGHLNSTLLILFGDHGGRWNIVRQTVQGTLEERLPYFTFRFPPWFHEMYPTIVENFRTNTKRLSTPLDIHATFKDILNYPSTKNEDVRSRGMSLFKEIPKERTCTQAGITPHWCACLLWQPVGSSDPLVKQAVTAAVTKINNLTHSQRTKCAQLTLKEITKGALYIPSSEDLSAEAKWLKFVNANSPPPALTHRYRVAFITLPGEAHFEVTSEYNVKSRTFSVNENQISRINKYGTQPACILKSKPHLRPYCFCV